MASFRLSVVRQAGLVLLQAAQWPLAAGLRRIRGCSTRKAPPPARRADRGRVPALVATSRPGPGSCPRASDRNPCPHAPDCLRLGE